MVGATIQPQNYAAAVEYLQWVAAAGGGIGAVSWQNSNGTVSAAFRPGRQEIVMDRRFLLKSLFLVAVAGGLAGCESLVDAALDTPREAAEKRRKREEDARERQEFLDRHPEYGGGGGGGGGRY